MSYNLELFISGYPGLGVLEVVGVYLVLGWVPGSYVQLIVRRDP